MAYLIAEELTEIVDDRGHFQFVPPKPLETYPDTNEALQRLKNLHEGFGIMRGFREKPLVDGNTYHFIAGEYVQRLINWYELYQVPNNPCPLAVDNSSLVEGRNKSLVKQQLLYSQLVSPECWNQLIDWFGGGVSIKMKCVNGVIPNGKILKVVCMNDPASFRRFYFHPETPLAVAKQEICEAFEVVQEFCRIHDIYKLKPHRRLDSPNEMRKPLNKLALINDNFCFLEVTNSHGEFTIIYSERDTTAVGDGFFSDGAGTLETLRAENQTIRVNSPEFSRRRRKNLNQRMIPRKVSKAHEKVGRLLDGLTGDDGWMEEVEEDDDGGSVLTTSTGGYGIKDYRLDSFNPEFLMSGNTVQTFQTTSTVLTFNHDGREETEIEIGTNELKARQRDIEENKPRQISGFSVARKKKKGKRCIIS